MCASDTLTFYYSKFRSPTTKEAVKDNINEYGVFYLVEGNLQGINNRNLAVVTVWLQSKYDRSFRFITLKPKKN